ncbi:MAG: hypothetical protein ACXWLN_18175 [Thermoanaerobaculia bacterium]
MLPNGSRNLSNEYIDRDAVDTGFPYNVDAVVRDFPSLFQDAVALEYIHVPVVTLLAEKYVEKMSGRLVLVDDVGNDLLVTLITACHEIAEFPLADEPGRTIQSEGLYIALLQTYLLVQLASHSELGYRLAAAIYVHDQALFDILIKHGKGLIEHADMSPSARIIRRNASAWAIDHERCHMLVEAAPYIRNARWNNIQGVLSDMAGLTSPVHEALCQFSRLSSRLRELDRDTVAAEELICDYVLWEQHARTQLRADAAFSSMMTTVVAAQNFINALARLAEMQYLLAPFILTGSAPSTEKMDRFDVEVLSRRWICFEALSQWTIQHHFEGGREGAAKPTARQIADFVGRSEWPAECAKQLGPHVQARHRLWTATMKYFNPYRLRNIATAGAGPHAHEGVDAFHDFVRQWHALCVSFWTVRGASEVK